MFYRDLTKLGKVELRSASLNAFNLSWEINKRQIGQSL